MKFAFEIQIEIIFCDFNLFLLPKYMKVYTFILNLGHSVRIEFIMGHMNVPFLSLEMKIFHKYLYRNM